MLEAPGKSHCIVRGSFSDWRYDAAFTMNPTLDGKHFWIDINNLDSGEYYTYQYLVDLDLEIADPYSETILDPVDDPHLDLSYWSGIPEFPSLASSNVTLFQAGGYRYDWKYNNDDLPEKQDLNYL